MHLLLDVVLVVVQAHGCVGTPSQRPVNHADPVVGLRVVRLDLDMALMEGLRFLEALFVNRRRACHLEEQGADAVDGCQIVADRFPGCL